jgi:hypothetical protein
MSDCNILESYLNLRFDKLKDQIMSELSDKIAQVQSSQDDALARVSEDVAGLQAQIDDLRTKVSTPEDIAALDAIDAKNRALDPVQPDTLPAE